MLPIPMLDDEGFREIAENARSMIPRLCPDWTDFNYHDPGITFLELFAFLKESQQYHLDQIGPRNREKYLKLLGMERLGRAPARTVAAISAPARTGTLPRGVRLLAGDIPFETQRTVHFSGGRLRGGFGWDGAAKAPFSLDGYAQEGKLQLPPFGWEPERGNAWHLRFDDAFSPLDPVRLQLWLQQDWPVRRNPPVGEDFFPLVELGWDYLTPTGWQPLTVETDETQGFLFSGQMALRPGADACPLSQAPQEEQDFLLEAGYWLRVRLLRGSYDVPPVLTGLSDEMVPVVQVETDAACLHLTAEAGETWDDSLLSAAGTYELYLPDARGFWRREPHPVRRTQEGRTHFSLSRPYSGPLLLLCWRPDFAVGRRLAVGDGFPHQSYELPRGGQVGEHLCLLVAEADEPQAWSLWQQVADFDASGPEDRHYLLDEETGVIHFGDCLHGLAPEGEILLAGHAVTLGADGNIKEGQLRELHNQDRQLCGLWETELRITSPDGAIGGRKQESLDHCFSRCRQLLRQSDRAVTYADYERLVRQTPGLMVSNCKAVPVTRLPRQDGSLEEDCVTVVVEPFSLRQTRSLSPAYRENIRRHLEERRMLGSRVLVQAPEYVGISVYAELLSQPHYLDAKARIQAAVADFFQQGWDFGSPVRYSALYGILDTLDCVQGIETLTIDAQGKGITRGINGDVLLPHNGLAVLKSAVYQVRPAE